MTLTRTDRLVAIDTRIEQLTARRERLLALEEARKLKTRRRIDVRCKIEIGSAFAALVKARDPDAVRIYRELRAAMSKDAAKAKAFSAWHADPLPDAAPAPVPDLDSGGSA